MPHRPKISRRQIANLRKPHRFFVREPGIEHPLKEKALAHLIEIIELELESEASHDRLIEIIPEVCRTDHHPLEILHAVQKLVHLRHLPAALRPRTVLNKSIDLIEKENRVLRLRLIERGLDVLLCSADPHRKEIAPHLDDHLAVDRLGEILDEFSLSGSGRSPKKKVHPRPIDADILSAVDLPEIVSNRLRYPAKLDIALEIQPLERIILCRKHNIIRGLGFHKLAVRLHQPLQQSRHLICLRRHVLEIFQDHGNAACICIIFPGKRAYLGFRNDIFKRELLYVVLPDVHSHGMGKLLEAYRIIETPTNGIVHGIRRRIRNPDNRVAHGIKHRIDLALL